MKHLISIIIPVFNEVNNISPLLNHLSENASKENISEIIFVDGGSTDGSQEKIQSFESLNNFKILLLNAEKGRAKQMNFGAKYAQGNILYFLHADSLPPKNFDAFITNQVNNGNQAGCFKMKFNSNHVWLKIAGWFTQFNWKSCRGGDQSLFITPLLFNTMGGYNEDFIIYEDNDFISKLYARNQFVVIPEWLTTSARCYKSNGIGKLQYHYWTIHIKKWLGASPKVLNDYYFKHINVKN
ncbi:TIGR04283 family arsenosugar biosynthesis glycosyltransferase [Thalassobellus sediminis]|uniref:TIGR04283 family arsenosugar biosynthesis glycosyltransferase n=1 Tax=Thalassobellus sediminis TaxID=3367753 RepID=UPI00379A62B7